MSPHLIDAVASLTNRLASLQTAARLQAIANATVRDAAADEVQHVATTLIDLVQRCRCHTIGRTRDLDTAQSAAKRLLAVCRRVLSRATHTTYCHRNTAVRWNRGLDAVKAIHGIPRSLTRADLMHALPKTAWAYPTVQPPLHPLYGLLSPAGVRPSSLVLAAHRYHTCPVVRADARIALTESQVLHPVLKAATDRLRSGHGRA